jgi:hypothetical protein
MEGAVPLPSEQGAVQQFYIFVPEAKSRFWTWNVKTFRVRKRLCNVTCNGGRRFLRRAPRLFCSIHCTVSVYTGFTELLQFDTRYCSGEDMCGETLNPKP